MLNCFAVNVVLVLVLVALFLFVCSASANSDGMEKQNNGAVSLHLTSQQRSAASGSASGVDPVSAASPHQVGAGLAPSDAEGNFHQLNTCPYLYDDPYLYPPTLGCTVPNGNAVYCPSSGGTGIILGLTPSCGGITTPPYVGVIYEANIQFSTTPNSGVFKIKVVAQSQAAGQSNEFITVRESTFTPQLTTALQAVTLHTPLLIAPGQYVAFYSQNIAVAAISGSSSSYWQCGHYELNSQSFQVMNPWSSYVPNLSVNLYYEPNHGTPIGCFSGSTATSGYCYGGGQGIMVQLVNDPSCFSAVGPNFPGATAMFPYPGNNQNATYTISQIAVDFAQIPTSTGTYSIKLFNYLGYGKYEQVAESFYTPQLCTGQQLVQLQTALHPVSGQYWGYYSSNAAIASIPGNSYSYYLCGTQDTVITSATTLNVWTSYIPNIQVFYF